MFSKRPFSLLFRCLSKTVYPSPGDIRLNTNYLYTGRSAILKVKQNTQTVQTKNMVCVQRIERGLTVEIKSSVYNLVWKGHTMVRNVYHGPPYWYGLQLDMG